MSVIRPGNNQERRIHQLHMIIATINSNGTFSHKIQMGDMCLWQIYPCIYVLILKSVQKLALAFYGVCMGRPMTHKTVPVNPLVCHWHYMRPTMADSWNCPYKPLSCHTLRLHGSTLVDPHEVAHVKPHFCHSLVLLGAHICWPMRLPMLSHSFAKHWYYMGFTLLVHETAHV